ncbi:MAG: nicotinamide mononucleotide deamidase-related protein [Candidatus Bathyarchaeota archaeon]|nr:nicotinamide mononucleotide deamidase-related protein [Candidatus Bathyarchaeota archaeon]
MDRSVEIICIGNELLIGKILNTNAQWLARRITNLGLNVSRITIVGDDVNEISNIIKEILQRQPRFIITTGGLGPTFDDKTLQGIAKAMNCPLQIHEEALKMIEKRYQHYLEEGLVKERVELTSPRIKMATLPKGASTLPNPIGTAPGVSLKQNNVTIIALPGVPPEMEAIFDNSVVTLLKDVSGDVTFYETSISVTGIMESDIAPLIDTTMHDNPYVYIKSHPHGGEEVPHLELHFSTTAQNSNIAKKHVSRALLQITELIQAKGGKIKPTKPNYKA